jgi:glutamate racemase
VTLPRIGVFDSGVGGLTVLKALAERLPAHYFYFGDTARLPYGTKSAETVARYAVGATRFLESQKIDLLVIACNTASALALPEIKNAASVPVVGVVEPGAAMAAEVSKSRKAVVIATEATVSSHAYRDALQRHGVEAFEKACPLFVPLVEEGWTEHPVTEQVARIYLDEALAIGDGADVLVLACTHYPLIAPLLRRTAPVQMTIVDSAESTASVVKKMVDEWDGPHPTLSQTQGKDGVPTHGGVLTHEVEAPALMRGGEATQNDPRFSAGPSHHRSFQFFVTDSVEKFKKLATRFLGRQVDRVEHVDLGG